MLSKVETKLGRADENEAAEVCACGRGSAIIISEVLKYGRIKNVLLLLCVMFP